MVDINLESVASEWQRATYFVHYSTTTLSEIHHMEIPFPMVPFVNACRSACHQHPSVTAYDTVRRARNRRSTELGPIGRTENSRSTELGLNAGHAECPAGRWWEEVEKSGEDAMTGRDVTIVTRLA
ncbi:hypothetical protein EV421DRAFT_1743037 [Armillaria borealis]|uniref:Uncharacterized protein n=1 Tax=Armillaria borealis TaxID=47425 RepID=A0AA39MF62_9AGAR|nr:hypothetical protein EV421DRAFT_1743037 [Armillaria borealis]